MTKSFITRDITLRGGLTKPSSRHNPRQQTHGSLGQEGLGQEGLNQELVRRTGHSGHHTGMGKVANE